MKKALIIAGSAMAIFMGLAVTTLFAAVMFFGDTRGERIEFKNGELFYTKYVTEEDAKKLAMLFEKLYGDFDNHKTMQVDRSDKEVIVRMCAMPNTWNTDELDESFRALEFLIQTEVFEGQNVRIELCDQYLQMKKTIDHWPNEKSKPQVSEKTTN